MLAPITGEGIHCMAGSSEEKRGNGVQGHRFQGELFESGPESVVEIIGQSPPVRELLSVIRRVAPSMTTVLLLGRRARARNWRRG
jgi:transcriptional regulator with GAF, ATPase, and Fis domain